MARRARFSVSVAGTNITPALSPVLIGISVSDRAGTHTDTATLEIDDTDGRIVLPGIGVDVTVALGWDGDGMRVVFEGTVDEVRSTGSRSGGRRLCICAKGMDTTGKAKEGQQRHWDDATVQEILTDAAAFAGITQIEVDPGLAGIARRYFEMHDESLIAMGERLAREIGGNFRIAGPRLIFSKRGGAYAPMVRAAWGDNLHGWDMSPRLGRPQFGETRARWYDMARAAWQQVEKDTALEVEALHAFRFARADAAESGQQAGSDSATTERDAGEGSVTIEGNTDAVPDGLCVITGTRAGIDGAYRIEAVAHSYARSGGFVTTLALRHPQLDAGRGE